MRESVCVCIEAINWSLRSAEIFGEVKSQLGCILFCIWNGFSTAGMISSIRFLFL